MSKHNKMTIQEAVGDTSGYSDIKRNPRTKKITVIASLVGIAILIIVCIFLFTSPKKVEFKYQDLSKPSERYILDKETNKLLDAPKDPKKTYFDFCGWYLSSDYKDTPLFNNEEDSSLKDFVFPNNKTLTLYAKWTPTVYKVTYVLEGIKIDGGSDYRINVSDEILKKLALANSSLLPSTYTYSHEVEEFELDVLVQELREKDPDKYVNSPDAFKNVNDAITQYKNDASISVINLPTKDNNPLEIAGWVFLGFYDENDKLVEQIDKRNPRDMVIYAHWTR